MEDIENDLESDHEVSKEHSKLLEEISKLDKGRRLKKPVRSEPSLQVSEFHLVNSGVSNKESVPLKELLHTLENNPTHRPLTQKLKSLKTTKALAKPLEKPQADKLKREVGFENTKKEIQKWDAIITRNRAAPKLSFPLSQGKVSLKGTTTDEFVKRFRVQSDLEKELAALEPPKQEEESKTDEFSLTLGEILEKRREAARFRAQQSYREAKAHRQNKIKSKKFHRIARKAKIKQQIKEFEVLQKTDPVAAMEKLEQLDRTRAEERMSLRHKSTGQWARNKQVRAKYDTESRKVLAQQLSISKELTQKVKKVEDSEEEDEGVVVDGGDNPWTNPVKSEEEIQEFVKGYRKYWEERNKTLDQKKERNRDETVAIIPVDVPEDLNPVESVLEEVVEKNPGIMNGDLKNIGKKKKTDVEKSGNPGNKKPRTPGKIEWEGDDEGNFEVEEVILKGKVVKVKKLQKKFTSDWTIESFPRSEIKNNDFPVDIDELFDRMEGKIKKKAKNKMRKVQQKLRKLERLASDEQQMKESKALQSDLSFKRTKFRPDIDEAMDETLGDEATTEDNRNPIVEASHVRRESEIDPTKFISVKPKHLKTQLPDEIGEGAMDDSDEDEDQRNIISEAFAEDDVVEEFRKDKENEIKKSQPEDLDLRLPGWGSWGGKNISQNSRKKRRFIMKFPKDVPRKDENKGDVIIVEGANTQIKRHLVGELPYPFTSVAEYEASIRAPIGRDFVPENAHKRLIEPEVSTKMGTIIEPMDEEVLVKKSKITGLLPDKQKIDKKSDKRKAGIKRKKIE
ncbi:U3 small nucleolar RNA-associated protein 14 homolog C [Fopius arisanus]|uniref:U3 small nucleolar RNA-associated protein 14 homolog C n=1 Tax=Fopius arisanus TaxID=64838 RepID=A0A0C9R535_9HYME|nr:PREDICTED: U3 small nucleolar RNA-associated protein 14 homolog C [Fopius arisanus]